MCKTLKPGVTFLDNKIQGDKVISLHGKVVVDKSDWETVIKFFKNYPDQFDKMIGNYKVVGKFPMGDNEMETKL